METAGDIIRDALTELTIQAQEQTVPAVDLNTGVRYLNRMMQALDAEGVKLGYTLVNSPNDPLTVPAGAYEGMVFNLAVRLANGFDVSIGPGLAASARDGRSTMYKLGINLGEMNFPSILPIGSGNEGNAELYEDQHFFPGCCEDQDTCEETA